MPIFVSAQIFYRRLRQSLRDFAVDRAGNIAIIFALASIPLIAAIGAAIDLGRANDVKVRLQSATDAVALKLSNEAASDTTAQLQSEASKYFQALFTATDVQGTSVNATYSSNGGTSIVVNGSTEVPTVFFEMFGIDTIPVGATSKANWGSVKLKVALVLDNTGSMAQSGKMTALKTAATNFLSQLQSAAQNDGDVYVSIIPFTTSVNVGGTNYTQSWVDWTDYGSCSGGGRFGGDNYTTALCKAAGGSWSSYSSSQRSSWTGCVTDRGGKNGPTGQNYDTNADPPASPSASKYPAVDYANCPQQAIGLGYSWTVMNSLINAMSPNGFTNQNIGLQLGWMSLVGGGPFTVPATDPSYTYQKIIVLFTDGLNTEDRWYTDQASIDARQAMTCANIKNAGIVLYTVQISTDGTPQSSLLQNCATDTSKFFFLTSSSQLVTTFAQIGTNLANLYLAK